MQPATESDQVILGEQRYAVERFRGRWPDSLSIGLFSTLAVDTTGAVFVAQRQSAPVLVFESNGDYREQWESDGVTDPQGINITVMHPLGSE